MAEPGQVESDLNGVPADQRALWIRIFRYVLRNLRVGHPTGEATSALTNFAGSFVSGTTAATPGDEFTLVHGLTGPPYQAIPVLPLDVVGGMLVPLTVSRVADSKRLYLTSTVASAPITLWVEG